MDKCSNYVVAGSFSYSRLSSNFIEKRPDYISPTDFSEFMKKTVNKFLISFGYGITAEKGLPSNQDEIFLKIVDFMLGKDFMKEIELYWDSGGFQVAQGYLKRHEIDPFINMYYNTIKNNSDKCKYAFNLDLPPGPLSSHVFKSYRDVEDLNRLSYQKCLEIIPKDVIRDKMIYVHHFRTPCQYEIWNRFLDEDLADGYTYFGTGGIVANLAKDISIPIILYCIPLSRIVKYAKAKGLKSFKFHVLGGANYIDVFYHNMFERAIKEYHGIDVEITFDSSALFKALAIGRYIHVKTNSGPLVKMDLRSLNMNRRLQLDEDIKVIDKCYNLINDIATKYNFKQLDPVTDPFYLENGNMNGTLLIYLICYALDLYKVLEMDFRPVITDLCTCYRQKDKSKFNKLCKKTLENLNQGNATTKINSKINSLYKSLEILETLDQDTCWGVVDKYLRKDEIPELMNAKNPSFLDLLGDYKNAASTTV